MKVPTRVLNDFGCPAGNRQTVGKIMGSRLIAFYEQNFEKEYVSQNPGSHAARV
jgi:hypothetical protein